jgi:hypothetical protein
VKSVCALLQVTGDDEMLISDDALCPVPCYLRPFPCSAGKRME